MPFIATKDGAQLYWHEWGAGAPILFLSSLGCASRMWDYQMAAFADEGYRCIGFDRRGHGRSDQPASGYDFDTFADDVAALVETLDLKGLTLIAHSMAGGEAVRYLTRHGSTARHPPHPPRADDADAAQDPRQSERLAEGSLRGAVGGVAPRLSEMGRRQPRAVLHSGDVARDDALGRDPVADLASRHPRLLPRHGRSGLPRRDEAHRRSNPHRPWRPRPVDAPRTDGKPSAELIPGSRLLVYPGAPHGLMFTHMGELHADLVAFMREREARSAAA